jgi:5-methylcytosine-specific restriction endonuclease McrA
MSFRGNHHTPESIAKMSTPHLRENLSPETLEKMSPSHMGLKNALGAKHSPEAIEAKRIRQLGRKYSLETRNKVRASKMGEKNPAWKDGRSSITKQVRECYKNRQWRSDIFTKDNFSCVFCGQRGGLLEADHYPKSFSSIFDEYEIRTIEDAFNCEEFWNLNNGRTLCRKCHDKTKRKEKCA